MCTQCANMSPAQRMRLGGKKKMAVLQIEKRTFSCKNLHPYLSGGGDVNKMRIHKNQIGFMLVMY